MDKSNLIVNYLPTAFGEDDLKQLFTKFGPIQSIKVGYIFVISKFVVRLSGTSQQTFLWVSVL
jgi:hypothetical protein